MISGGDRPLGHDTGVATSRVDLPKRRGEFLSRHPEGDQAGQQLLGVGVAERQTVSEGAAAAAGLGVSRELVGEQIRHGERGLRVRSGSSHVRKGRSNRGGRCVLHPQPASPMARGPRNSGVLAGSDQAFDPAPDLFARVVGIGEQHESTRLMRPPQPGLDVGPEPKATRADHVDVDRPPHCRLVVRPFDHDERIGHAGSTRKTTSAKTAGFAAPSISTAASNTISCHSLTSRALTSFRASR